MAIDSVLKRKSVAGVGRKWRPGVVIPSGSLSQADRQVISRSYAGILAGGAPPVVADVDAIVEPVNMYAELVQPVQVEPFDVVS